MDAYDLDLIRSLRIQLCLEAHSHIIELGMNYSPMFTKHDVMTAAITSLSLDDAPYHHPDLQSIELLAVLCAIQEHEELVITNVRESGDRRDALEVEHACGLFDLELVAYLDLSHRARVSANATVCDQFRQEYRTPREVAAMESFLQRRRKRRRCIWKSIALQPLQTLTTARP